MHRGFGWIAVVLAVGCSSGEGPGPHAAPKAGAPSSPKPVKTPPVKMVATRWNACREGKALWAVLDEGLGHNWPSKERGGFDGGRMAWEFFFDAR